MRERSTTPARHTGFYPGKTRSIRAIRRIKEHAAILLVTGLCSFMILAGAPPATAQQSTVSPAWTVVQVTGDVRVRAADPIQNDAGWQALVQGARIAGDSEIETGPTGRARLSRGEDVIQIMPVSRLAIPPQPPNSILTRIRVFLGKAFFDVDKRPGQEFEVQTPYLAAIVKGTSFSVSVTNQRARVNVAEGRVGVTALGSGQSVIVGAGQSARVTTEPGSGVSTDTLAPGEFDSPAPTDDGTPAEGPPGGDEEQRGEGRGKSDSRDQAGVDNPGQGGEKSQGRGKRFRRHRRAAGVQHRHRRHQRKHQWCE